MSIYRRPDISFRNLPLGGIWPWHIGCSTAKEEYTTGSNNMKNLRTIMMSGLVLGALLSSAPAYAHGKGKFHVPPGHQPPAGKCRIWFPGRPPGHQPPAGDCRTLSRQVPPGAWLLGRDRRWSYDELRDRRVGRGSFERHGYDRAEVRRDVREVRRARAAVRRDREQLASHREELKRDRAELRNDIRDGAGRREIRRDRREIRGDLEKIADKKEELRDGRERLEAARDDLRRR
jgi:hypothetical protein